MQKKPSSMGILRRLHEDEQGAQVSLENVLIIGAIALPILIFLLKVGWPMVKNYFLRETQELTREADNVQH